MILNLKQNFWKITAIALALLIVTGTGAVIVLANKNLNNKNTGGNLTGAALTPIIKPVSAAEVYPMFYCPCCGQPLDKNNICCPMAQERVDYIDSLVKTAKSENDVLLAYVKKYGLDSFVDKNKKTEIKEYIEKTAPAERPVISITPATRDLGDISQKKGIATTFFDIKNTGEKDLIINKLDSSCGCTSAAIVFEGKEGPRFAMAGHGIESPTDWQIAIPAGKTAQLKVYYDPSVHKDLRGAVTREVSIYSNDPINFEKKITIDLNQVD